jgi:hypothetical protein
MWLLLCTAALAWGAKNEKAIYPPQKLNAQGIERIEITGVRGTLHLTGTHAKNFRLKVGHTKKRSEDWNLSVERRGHTLVFEVSNIAFGREWKKMVRQDQWPEFDIDLEGPALPTVVSWREGSLRFDHWHADIETAFLNGDVKVEGGDHQFVLQSVNAHVSARHFKGTMDIKGERGQVDLFAIAGQLHMNWLEGPINLWDVRAQTQVETQTADVRVHGGRGEWSVRSRAGSVNIRDFAGQMKAQGEDAHWQVRGRDRAEIELESRRGPVHVDWKSASRVFLTSDRGAISSPYTLQDRDGRRVAEGRTGGRAAGQVFVRTETGDITFKY